jgi:hypothetical protein
MNKGEHSETYAALTLLANPQILKKDYKGSQPPKWIVDSKVVSVIKDELVVHDMASAKTSKLSILNIQGLLTSFLGEIKKGKGVFACPSMEKVYKFLLENQVPLKAGSSTKVDLTIQISDTVYKLSVKSFLGSNPTVLNANKRATQIAFRLKGSKVIASTGNKSSIPKIRSQAKTGTLELEYSDFEDSNFKEYISKSGIKPERFAQMVVDYKFKGKGSSFVSHITDQDKQAFSKLATMLLVDPLRKASKGVSINDIPTHILAIEKSGLARIMETDELLSRLVLDSASQSRHDYGYIYSHKSDSYVNVAVSIRVKPSKLESR